MTHCPVCNGIEYRDTVRRDRLPAMQNYVYRTRESAVAAPKGQLTLAVCLACGFAWNRTFDPSQMVYDAGYDNAVPSTVMQSYYLEIAEYLRHAYDLEDGLIVDVGCGSGAFLKTICAAVPGSRGLGIDPALCGDREEEGGRIVLIKDVFDPDAIKEPASMIVSRHVLEHLPRPVEFLRSIRAAVKLGAGVCFLEVPDLDWIIENGALWDFCYEHCSYFTEGSCVQALRQAGLEPVRTRAAFGSQYRWIEASLGYHQSPRGSTPPGDGLAERLLAYAAGEADRIASIRESLHRWKDAGSAIAVWGMATKGVLFSVIVDPEDTLIDVCIDANANKQGCFVPLTGHPISAPATLRDEAKDRPLVVIVMNENYRDEIQRACHEMSIKPTMVGVAE